jgi:hypothetical protein
LRWPGPDVNQANKFTVEGEKRYWLHPFVAQPRDFGVAGIALGRDLVSGASGCP